MLPQKVLNLYMAKTIDMMAVMQHIPEILGLELVWRKDAWEGRYYLNGDRHPYKRDKLKVKFWKAPDGNTHIVLYEQGGNHMSLQTWLVHYGGAMDWKHARDIMRGCKPCALELGNTRVLDNEVRYVGREVLEEYKGYELERCNLFVWMCRMFGESRVREVWDAYNVTTNERGEVVFWYVDPEGRILHDKIMRFRYDGHRDKSHGGYRKFTTAMGHTARCYFGSHLIEDDCDLHLVEGEKTALIMACASPDKIWLASGGLNQVRDVDSRMWLYPDIDGISKWESITGAQIVSWWENYTDVGDHDDIADAEIRLRMKNVYTGRYR